MVKLSGPVHHFRPPELGCIRHSSRALHLNLPSFGFPLVSKVYATISDYTCQLVRQRNVDDFYVSQKSAPRLTARRDDRSNYIVVRWPAAVSMWSVYRRNTMTDRLQTARYHQHACQLIPCVWTAWLTVTHVPVNSYEVRIYILHRHIFQQHISMYNVFLENRLVAIVIFSQYC